jgi:tetratricopeptide (TPR) repeat protein
MTDENTLIKAIDRARYDLDRGLVKLVFSKYQNDKEDRLLRYEQAGRLFQSILNKLENNENRYNPKSDNFEAIDYVVQGAAFGLGLTEGMKEYETYSRPVEQWRIANAAKEFCKIYRTSMKLNKPNKPANVQQYIARGQSYALLGLFEEALIIFEKAFVYPL